MPVTCVKLDTDGHSARVADLMRDFSNFLSNEGILNKNDVKYYYEAGMYHDIGKLSVDQSVLTKKSKLTAYEYNHIKLHTVFGSSMVKYLKLDHVTDKFSETLLLLKDTTLYHHERWDGMGYPTGISELDIPIVARICCIIDSYDAMINARCYKEAMDYEYVITEMKRCSGTQFDPNLLRLFIEFIES